MTTHRIPVFAPDGALTRDARPDVPVVMQGAIYENAGKYARGAVLYAFEAVGGPQGLAEWAQDNPDAFYTKMFTKIITKEVEVTDRRGIDELLDALDGEYSVVQDAEVGVGAVEAAPGSRHTPPGAVAGVGATLEVNAPAPVGLPPPATPPPLHQPDYVPYDLDALTDFET